MNLITEIIFIFVIYSFIGWILESLYKSIIQKRIINSGFLIGPFCPIYGYGALIMYYALESLKNNIFILFVASFIILSIWEYIVGLLLEITFKTKYWDYSDRFCNMNGRVCLLNSCFWGVLGCVFILILNPFIFSVASKIPTLYMTVFLVVSITYIVVDTIITAINVMLITIMHFPCATTLLTIKNETKSLKWTALAFLIPTICGIVVCMMTTGIYNIFS